MARLSEDRSEQIKRAGSPVKRHSLRQAIQCAIQPVLFVRVLHAIKGGFSLLCAGRAWRKGHADFGLPASSALADGTSRLVPLALS
jgi:hypothetical protein